MKKVSVNILQEELLVKRIKKGDSVAWRELYNTHAGALFATCQRYLSDDEDVKDVMQEAFMLAFRNIDTFVFKKDGGLRLWLNTIVTNQALKLIRKQGVMPTSALTDNCDFTDDNISELDDIPPDIIHDMVRKLPVGYRTVLNLFIFEDKSHEEISQLLGISKLTSASQLCRAKKLLHQMLLDYKRRNQ